MIQTKIGKPDSEIIPVATELIRKVFNTLPGMKGQEVSITLEEGDRGNRIFWIYGQGELWECTIYWGQWNRLRFGKVINIKPEQFKLKQKKAA